MASPAAFEGRQLMEQRLIVLRVILTVVFGILAASFWTLQVLDHERYREAAENNHLRTIPRRAPRGVLFDRDGRVLVDNRQTQTIAIIRERSANLTEAIQRLALALELDATVISDILQRHKRDPLFRPIPIVEHATMDQAAAVRARELELPEVVVQAEPTRTYPVGLGAHLFGYVGEIQEAQLDRPEFTGLQAGAIIGQAGLERVYNARLMGQDGHRDVVVNSFGREMQQLGEQKAVEGSRLQLTIDLDLQRALEEAFAANGYSGAAVFLDPSTGEILAMTSQPAFDPNSFATGVDRVTWSRLNTDPLRPLQDRLIQGMYSPGSTFKILMAIAGLSEGVITPETTFTCPGYAVFYGHKFECDKKAPGHGTLDLRHAIEKSCNVYLYNVANRLKIDQIHDYAVKLGLSGRTGIDLPGEVESLVPSTEWKMRTRGEKWYPGETISVGIGQGQVSVTPIALATMITTVGNGGTVVTPHVVKAVDMGDGWQPIGAPAPRSVFPIRPEVLAAVHDGLWMVVNEAGTGSNSRIEGHDVSGKTGTSQVISNQGKAAAAGKSGLDLRDNAWFEFFAPRDNPTISGVVMAEHAGHGGTASAPIARYVLETYFAKREGKPLPKLPAEMAAKLAARIAAEGGGR